MGGLVYRQSVAVVYGFAANLRLRRAALQQKARLQPEIGFASVWVRVPVRP